MAHLAFRWFATVFMMPVFCAVAFAQPTSLKQVVGNLKILPLQYGTNSISINGHTVLIVKGAFENGNAWGGTAYSVLMEQGNIWQLARQPKGGWESTLFEAQPHTGEDGITSLYFMVPKDNTESDSASDLYVLKVERKIRRTVSSPSDTQFTLMVLARNINEEGVLYFRDVQTERSKHEYCSSDLAAHQELGIPSSVPVEELCRP